MEATLRDVFVVGVDGVLAEDILVLDVLWQAEYDGRETIDVSLKEKSSPEPPYGLPVDSVQGPEQLLPRLASQCSQSEALLSLV